MNTANTNEALSNAITSIIRDISSEAKYSFDRVFAETKAKLEAKQDEATELVKTLTDQIDSVKNMGKRIVNIGTPKAPKKALVHSAFDTILRIIKSGKRKEKNVMLVGAAGGGKTLLVKTIANAIGRPFYPFSVGLQTTKSDLLGFINAHGVYMPSIIREAYEKGGVLLLDEFDCGHAGVITILNSLLANGHCSFPDKVVDKHPDFICLCACNTYGRGATVDYVGRNRLDAATLDRFIVVNVDYDEALEEILTQNRVWLRIVRAIRQNVLEQGIKHIVSSRASMDGADLLEEGFTVVEALDMTVFKGVEISLRERMLKGVKMPTKKELKDEIKRSKEERAQAEAQEAEAQSGNAENGDSKDGEQADEETVSRLADASYAGSWQGGEDKPSGENREGEVVSEVEYYD